MTHPEELRALVEDLRTALSAIERHAIVFTVEEDAGIKLSTHGWVIAHWGEHSPQGIALLKLEADLRRARTALTRAESLLSSVPDGGWNNLDALREANISRQRDWCPDQVPDLSFRGVELAGEAGEVCNVIKKLERERLGWRGSRDTVEHLAEELADVVICADLIGISAGIDLWPAIVAKFNATSEKVGLPHRLPASPQGSSKNG